MNIEESVAIVVEQLQILVIFLERPAVQRQLLALVAILISAWVIRAVVRFLVRGSSAQDLPTAAHRWGARLAALHLILAPILTIVLVQIALAVFRANDYAFGILQDSRPLLAVWLLYRCVLMGFYYRYGAAFRPYHYRVCLPLFLWFILTRIADNFVNLQLIGHIPLFTVFGADITVGSLLGAFLVLYGFLVVAWLTEGAVRRSMGALKSIDPGIVQSAVTITRYAVIIIGILLSLRILGVDLSTLAIIGGGLSVGVGFGLREIIANFVSGLVLLFEQAMLPGDVVEINGELGTVQAINMRSTTVRTINNVELVVPNETFLTNEVTTFTKTDNQVRVLMPFGVSYDSDPHQVRQVVSQAAAEHPLVLDDIAPDLLFRGFGDSSLDFDLAFWIDQPEKVMRVRSDLYYMVWDALKANDIEIPFPQRDLNLRRGWGEVFGG